jgi:hypothetical protein
MKGFSHAIVKYMAKLIPDRFSAVSGPKNLSQSPSAWLSAASRS